jgi:hypothetical protein
MLELPTNNNNAVLEVPLSATGRGVSRQEVRTLVSVFQLQRNRLQKKKKKDEKSEET